MSHTVGVEFFVVGAVFVMILLLVWLIGRNKFTYEDGYEYGLSMRDHPADRAEAESLLAEADLEGTTGPFEAGIADALDWRPKRATGVKK